MARENYFHQNLAIERYLVWKEVQSTLAAGFSLFYDSHDFPELFRGLALSPGENVHIMPGNYALYISIVASSTPVDLCILILT